MTSLQNLPDDPTVGKEIIQSTTNGPRKVRVLRYEADDMNEGYAVLIIDETDPSVGTESWMSAANVARQLGSDDEFRRLRAFADQKINTVYVDLDQDVRDLFAERDELAEKVRTLEAQLRVPQVDTLEVLLGRKRKLMTLLGIPAPTPDVEYLNSPYFMAACIGLVSEAAEVLDALSVISKPWKQVDLEKTRALVLEESLDVLFMLLEVYLDAGFTPADILRRFDDKLMYNLGRLLRVTNNNHPEAALWLAELMIRNDVQDAAAGVDRKGGV
jgi:NTP pyrophosphatase (non-canonical NTP hydrolase)